MLYRCHFFLVLLVVDYVLLWWMRRIKNPASIDEFVRRLQLQRDTNRMDEDDDEHKEGKQWNFAGCFW
jgi:hypothetical protein